MTRTIRTLRQGLFAAAVTAGLAFGASQALASPAPAASAGVCPATPGISYSHQCEYACQQKGFPAGYCDSGACTCVVFP